MSWRRREWSEGILALSLRKAWSNHPAVRFTDFALGKRVKAFSGIEPAARLKLDRLEAAVTLRDLAVLPEQPFRSAEGRPQGVIQHPH